MQAVGALERGHRRAPQRETLAQLVEALALDPGQRAGFEAVARQSGVRPIARGVTEGPWPLSALPMLPLALTSFVGHETVLREVADHLRERRLVTLTGPGGIGKTRIALEVGSGAIASGTVVRLVELAAVAERVHVVSAIAAALHVQSVPNQDVLDTVAAYLQREELLLVLDNCEHVIDEAARVAERLLRYCSALRICATSREPLRVPGEIVYRVPALDIPPLAEANAFDAQRARAYSAVALFEARAQAVDFRFALTDADAGRVARICAQLDGIPLAIELAAARVATTSVATIAEHLARRFAILSRGERTAPARHRTMWDTIAWSYELLTQSERRVFERMSVFAGGCTLDAARSVCAGEGAREFEIEELLESLAAKSLLTVNIAGPETRFGMLESFREFAREKRSENESSAGLARAHARTYLALFEGLVAAFQTEPEDDVFVAVRADLDNWRAATAWAFGPLGDPELGQRLLLSAEWWLVETEARRWTDLALARIDAHTSNDIAVRLAYYEAKLVQRVTGNDVVLAEVAARSIAYFDAIGDTLSAARASFARCAALLRLGRLADAEPELDASLERARGAGSLRLIGYALIDIARMRLEQGELDRANAACAEALATFAELRSLIGRALSLQILAEIALRNGDPEAALNYGLEELACTRKRNEPNFIGVSLNNVAAFLIALDRLDEAHAYAREALDHATLYAHQPRQLWALQHFAAIAALRSRDEHQFGPAVRAARLIAFVDAGLAEIELTRDYFDRLEYDRILAVLDSLDVAEREAALAAGAAMTEAEAIREALAPDDIPVVPRV